MNNELNISKNISRDGFLVLPSVQTANFISKFHIATILTGSCYFCLTQTDDCKHNPINPP